MKYNSSGGICSNDSVHCGSESGSLHITMFQYPRNHLILPERCATPPVRTDTQWRASASRIAPPWLGITGSEGLTQNIGGCPTCPSFDNVVSKRHSKVSCVLCSFVVDRNLCRRSLWLPVSPSPAVFFLGRLRSVVVDLPSTAAPPTTTLFSPSGVAIPTSCQWKPVAGAYMYLQRPTLPTLPMGTRDE